MNCPHCEWPIEYTEVHDAFQRADFQTCWQWSCPQCHKTIRVEVTAIPHFHLFDPVEPSDTY